MNIPDAKLDEIRSRLKSFADQVSDCIEWCDDDDVSTSLCYLEHDLATLETELWQLQLETINEPQ